MAMNRNKLIQYLIVCITILTGCNKIESNRHLVKITTNFGEIEVMLYNETPKHTDNFIKLADNQFYDGIIFHRVIKNFVIQAGDPETKKSEQGKVYGDKDSGYLIDPEFSDTIIHKFGAIGMARESDNINPQKLSSGSQFYIVVGKVYTNEELDKLEDKINYEKLNRIKQDLYRKISEENTPLTDNKIKEISIRIENMIDSINVNHPFKFTSKQREIYTTIGGIPHLDGGYTVFGEVVKGMDVVKRISEVTTDQNDRPLVDITIKQVKKIR
jgi:cyclophilin family peptidyl-prolyl cis-trans isomerase